MTTSQPAGDAETQTALDVLGTTALATTEVGLLQQLLVIICNA